MSSRVVILGAGPAGLGAALGLARRGFTVDVLEQAAQVGGNAGSFELAGLRVDFGSHRLHPATAPEVFAEIRALRHPVRLLTPPGLCCRRGGWWSGRRRGFRSAQSIWRTCASCVTRWGSSGR